MELIAERNDGWFLYKEGGYFQESTLDLTSTKLSWDGMKGMSNSNKLNQLSYCYDSIRELLSKNAEEADLMILIDTLEPLIIKLWMENKLDSYSTSTYE